MRIAVRMLAAAVIAFGVSSCKPKGRARMEPPPKIHPRANPSFAEPAALAAGEPAAAETSLSSAGQPGAVAGRVVYHGPLPASITPTPVATSSTRVERIRGHFRS